MNTRIAIILAFVFALGAAGWAQEVKPYVDKQLACTVHFPAKVKVDRVKTRTGATRRIFVCLHEGRAYGMEVLPSPLGAKAKDLKEARQFVIDWSNRKAKECKGTVIAPDDFEMSGFACREFHYQSKKYKATFYTRVVVTDKYVYEVTIQAPDTRPLPIEDALAYLSTFELLDQKGSPPTTTPKTTVVAQGDIKTVQGKWGADKFRYNGGLSTSVSHEVTFQGDRLIHRSLKDGKEIGRLMFRVELNSQTTPKQIDYFSRTGQLQKHGVYELKGDTLRICSVLAKLPRPDAFKTEKGDQRELFEFHRLSSTAQVPHKDVSGSARGSLGIQFQDVSLSTVPMAELEPLSGAFLLYVVPDGPAARANLRPGDIVVRVDATDVKTMQDLLSLLKDRKSGQRVVLEWLREGKRLKAEMVFDAWPSDDAAFMRRARPLAEAGDPRSQWFVAKLYAMGKGVPRDDVKAVQWYRKAAEQGDAESQHAMGLAYLRGAGALKDPRSAAEWFYRAAVQGHSGAQNHLGILYNTGNGVTEDASEAAKWLAKAALRKNPQALNNLGWLYHLGRGAPQNDREAYRLTREAAETGAAPAQRNLGLLLAEGAGVQQDYEQAVVWLRKAAEQGDGMAENNMGLMYARGWGVPRDSGRAIAWFRKAAAHGIKQAEQNLRAMGASP